MNWRRGFFRVWAVVSLFFGVGIVILNYEKIADVLHRGTAEPSDWSAEVRAEPSDWSAEVRAGAGPVTFTPLGVVPTPCDKARGTKGTDYTVFNSAPGCWYDMPTFRRLYPEYNDIDEGKLTDRLDDLVPGSRGDSQSPWIVLGRVAGVALGVPLGLLVAGLSGAWALSGFRGGNPNSPTANCSRNRLTISCAEHHGCSISCATVQAWMIADGLWQGRRHRLPSPHQPRRRRDCLGELVQIDGSQHAWFEDRGPPCMLLGFVDDATSRFKQRSYFTSSGDLERRVVHRALSPRA